MSNLRLNPLLAAEDLGFYSTAIAYDRVYFWCLGEEAEAPFNPMIDVMRDATHALEQRVHEGTAASLQRVLARLGELWNAAFAKTEHQKLVSVYRELTGEAVPPMGLPDTGEPGALFEVRPAELARLRLMKSAPGGMLVNELAQIVSRCRNDLSGDGRAEKALDLGRAYGREWDERRYHHPAPLADWCYEELLGIETPYGVGGPWQSTMDLEKATTEVVGLASRVSANFEILAQRYTDRLILEKMGRPKLQVDKMTGLAEFAGVQQKLGEPALRILNVLWEFGGKLVPENDLASEVGHHHKAKSLLLQALAGMLERSDVTEAERSGLENWRLTLVATKRSAGYQLGVPLDDIHWTGRDLR